MQDFKAGDRVYYDGHSPLSPANAGNGTVLGVERVQEDQVYPGGPWRVDVMLDAGYLQVLGGAYLTAIDTEEMPDWEKALLGDNENGESSMSFEEATNAQTKALRAAIVGLDVVVDEGATALGHNGEELPAHFDGETKGTILPYPESAEVDYPEAENFCVLAEDGRMQCVKMMDVTPVDREALAAIVQKVGAEFAEARGIVEDAEVLLPPFTLEGLLFRVGRVVSVEDGVATVYIEGADAEQDYAAFSLRRAE